MPLEQAQLNTIVAHTLPGERLKEAHALSAWRYLLALASGERLELHVYDSAGDVANARAALQQLRGEIDLPIAQFRAADETGDAVGQPCLLTSALPGEPLAQVIDRVDGEALYAVGRQLGGVMSRVHRLSTTSYGALVGSPVNDERSYVLQRLDAELARGEAQKLLDRQIGAAIRDWFADAFQSSSTKIALLHGNLTPETILVRQTSATWRLSGVIDWEQALGWVPAWEHTVLLDAFANECYFGLRVGYGNGYDEQTQRTYEQVRERVLTPYRLLLALERMSMAYEHGDTAVAQQYHRTIEGALRLLDDDEARHATA